MAGPPVFDPSKPFSVLGASAAPSAPTFDPSKPFKMIGDEPDVKKPPSWLDSLGTFLEHGTRSVQAKTVWDSIQALNPFVVDDADPNYVGSPAYGPLTGNTAMGVSKALDRSRPLRTLRHVVEAQAQLAQKAEDDFKAGRYGEGVVKAIHSLVPVLGPQMQSAGEDISQGEYARGLGKTLDMAGQVAGPKLISKALGPLDAAGGATVLPKLAPKNPALAEAVAFGQREGIPLDAATVTDNAAVRAVQHVSDRSLGGSTVAGPAARATAEKLASVGEQLAAKGYPTATTVEDAGSSLRSSISGTVSKLGAEATTAYTKLRGIEAKTPMAVELGGVKQALTPLRDALLRQKELTGVLMGDKGRALVALDNLVNAPDAAALSTVDAALSDLKAMARADMPELRTAGQGAAAAAVRELDGAVQRAAALGGPDAVAALKAGRTATKAKYLAGETLEALKTEPVRTINGLLAAKDGGIAKLREIHRLAPDEMPKIGRAYLDDLMGQATKDGGFDRALGVSKQWDKLGAQTKGLLFDPGHVRDLDSFFLLAKKLAESPNPSGTAHTLLTAGQGGWILTEPMSGIAAQVGTAALSKVLHSRRGVQLLTQGMRVPLSNKVLSVKVASDLAKLAGPDWYQAPALAAQDNSRP